MVWDSIRRRTFTNKEKWTQISIEQEHFAIIAKLADKHDRSVAAELRQILRDAGVIPNEEEVQAR